MQRRKVDFLMTVRELSWHGMVDHPLPPPAARRRTRTHGKPKSADLRFAHNITEQGTDNPESRPATNVFFQTLHPYAADTMPVGRNKYPTSGDWFPASVSVIINERGTMYVEGYLARSIAVSSSGHITYLSSSH